MWNNVYDTPEKYGLEIIGSIDDGGGYEYDILCAWRHLETGKYYYGEDSGCSCNSAFEGCGIDSLEEIVLSDFKEVCSKRRGLNDAMELYREVEEKIKEAP